MKNSKKKIMKVICFTMMRLIPISISHLYCILKILETLFMEILSFRKRLKLLTWLEENHFLISSISTLGHMKDATNMVTIWL